MRIGVLGTGGVGETIAGKLIELEHEVMMGSRSASNEKAVAWVRKAGSRASAGTFEQAAAFGELLFNCTQGAASLDVLRAARPENLDRKVLIDVSNPLDFSKGMPPTLFVSNSDSLGEQIQREFPGVKVVKALNTMWAGLMVNPRLLPDDHTVFLSGNDAGAKDRVAELLRTFGWHSDEIFDLGDITTARGTESWLLLWVRIWGETQSAVFNLKLIRGKTG